jgi:hypothetical protein
MTKKVRGIFFTCPDFQGNTPQAVKNAQDACAGFLRQYRLSFENGIPEAREEALKKGIELTDEMIDQQFQQSGYRFRVVKVEI